MRMWQRTAGWLLLAVLLGRTTCGAAPYDLVPRGDWRYDALAQWAARGLVTGERGDATLAAREFHGDEPLTREAMARVVMKLVDRPEALPAGDQALLEQMVREFAPEIARAGMDPQAMLGKVHSLAEAGPHRTVRGTGFGLGRLGYATDDGLTIRGIYRAAGLATPNRYMLSQISITNERQLYSTDPTAFPRLEHAVVRLHTSFADWELGRTSNRWGPGWSGTMLLSDDAPALFQLNGRKRMSLGFLGHDYTFEQFVATLNDTGGARYVVARRISRPFGRRAGASISEAVKTTSARLLPLAVVLPLYLAADLTYNDVQNSNDVNYLAGLDFWYAPGKSVRLYGDFVLDDITGPGGLGTYSVPRKIGVLFGLHLPRLNAGRTDVRLEWALTDGEQPGSSVREGGTYIHRNPTLDWYHDGLPLGHRMGQNRRGPFARVRHRFANRITAIGEWEDETQWRPTPDVGDRRRLVLYGAYDLRPNRTVALRMERTSGALGRDTLWEVQGAYSF